MTERLEHLYRQITECLSLDDGDLHPRFRIGRKWIPAGPERDVALPIGRLQTGTGDQDDILPCCPDCGGRLAVRVAGREPGSYECAGDGRYFADGNEVWFEREPTPGGNRAGCGSRFIRAEPPSWADRIKFATDEGERLHDPDTAITVERNHYRPAKTW